VTGDKPECGLYFVSKADPQKRFKVGRKLAWNVSTRVGGIDLKQPKTVKSGFNVEVYK
jgi:hypothetical protein